MGIAGFAPAGGAVPVLTPRAPPSHPDAPPVDRSGLQSYVCARAKVGLGGREMAPRAVGKILELFSTFSMIKN